MTPIEIHTIQHSWQLLENVSRAALGKIFYDKLFTDHPGLRKIFPADMELQYQKLIDMLHSIITHLEEEEVMRPEIIAMGKRHAVYGVKPFHFRMVGAALLWMLQQQLGDNFTREVKQAWAGCFDEVSQIMLGSMKA